jgi:hypothetical protein
MTCLLRIRIALCAATVASVAWGCNGKTTPVTAVPTSNEEATVTGSVTIKGNKATSGTITFDPMRDNVAPRSSPIDKNGTYSIKTLVGPNEVVVTAPEFNSREADAMKASFNVAPGSNTYVIVLPPR